MLCRALVFVLIGIASYPAWTRGDDGPTSPTPLKVVIPPLPDFVAAGLNGRGDLVGFQWVEDPKLPGALEQRPVWVRGAEVTEIPKLEGYTATLPAGLSDAGHVVGRCGKPSPPGVQVEMRSQAFVWDVAHGIRGLGTLPGDILSYATAISRDGQTILGASLLPTGQPRACVWRLVGDDRWKAETLPDGSPISSSLLALSPDGRRAASLVGADAVLWSDAGDRTWRREVIARDGQLAPRAVNDSGTVAGLRHTTNGLSRAVVWRPEGGLVELEAPVGFVRAEALGINTAGLVVGFVDGPNGSPIGPQGFVWDGKAVRLLTEGGPGFVMATAINDAGQVAGVIEPVEAEPELPAGTEKPATPAVGTSPPPRGER